MPSRGELSTYLRENPAVDSSEDTAVSYRSADNSHSGSWWPRELGHPSSVGSQNDMRYAIFAEKHRLVIDDHGQVKIYDTGDHIIAGVSQRQSTGSTITFTSQHGIVSVSNLARVVT